MKTETNHARHHVGLILGLVGLVIGIALPLASANVAASAEPADVGPISSAHDQENPPSFNRWTSNGPEGGSVTALAIDPSNPAIIYAGAGGGVFKSTNGGESWSPSLSPDYNHATYTLAIDPRTPTTLYAGGNFGVSKSADGGTSWYTINNGLANQYGNAFVYSLAIDPGTPTTLYAAGCNCGGYPGISKSTDGGAHWNTLNTEPFNQDQNGNGYVINLAIAP